MKKETAIAVGTTVAITVTAMGVGLINQHSPFEIISLSDSQNTSEEEADETMGGGKCGAGKCGNEKRFEAVEVDPADIRDKLVKARDGQCGPHGTGMAGESVDNKTIDYQCAQGTCA